MTGSRWMGLALAALVPTLILAARVIEQGVLRVKPSVENFRDAPNGNKLGTLLRDTEIERISQEGEWVRFRVEGWVWGPSLEGFQAEAEESVEDEAEPSLPLRDALPRIKRYIDAQHGAFYSVELDEDLGRLTLRVRVRDLEPEALVRKQISIQQELLEIMGGELNLDAIRVESNRADGSGRVGLEIAETRVDQLQALDSADVSAWEQVTRVSHDGGKTWVGED